MSFLSPCYKPSHSSIHITKNKVHAKNLVLTEVCTHSPPTHIHTDKEQFLQHNYNVCRHSAFLMVVMEISLIRWRKCSFLSAHKLKKKKSPLWLISQLISLCWIRPPLMKEHVVAIVLHLVRSSLSTFLVFSLSATAAAAAVAMD